MPLSAGDNLESENKNESNDIAKIKSQMKLKLQSSLKEMALKKVESGLSENPVQI